MEYKLEYEALLSREAASSFVLSFVKAYGNLVAPTGEDAALIECRGACAFNACFAGEAVAIAD